MTRRLPLWGYLHTTPAARSPRVPPRHTGHTRGADSMRVVCAYPHWANARRVNSQLPGTMSGPLEVTLFGPVASAVLVLLEDRYDQLSVSSPPGADTLLTLASVDQAGERALLTLLWDTGHQVRSVLRTTR